ncbi:hypothetical protein [Spirosoma gilvum]
MKVVTFLLLLLFFSCRSDDTPPEPERIETADLYENQLFVDGCDSHVRIYSYSSQATASWFKPSLATQFILDKALKDLPANPTSSDRAAIVRFIETGKQVELECGWGNRYKVSEIHLLLIKKL